MRWSKLKQLVEDRMADSLQRRVEVHSTRYYSGQGRGWITVNKREVADMSHLRAAMESARIANEVDTDDANPEKSQPPLHAQWYASDSYAQVRRRQDIVLSQYEFHHLLWDSLSLSIEGALLSDHYLIRAFAMLDSRLGKRRLRTLQLGDDEHPLVRQFYDLRCEAEGIGTQSISA
ncbi:MAG: hypothetical protein M3176_06430 [Chloroflexota bacterium]|nr:hypothetical protein [Chloroflexota bacterium]